MAAEGVVNSGNVVFSTPGNRSGDLVGRIQKALVAKLGLTVPVIVLSRDEVVAAVEDNPLAGVAHNPSSLLVVSLRAPLDRDRLEPLLKEKWTPERLALGSRVAYLWCAKGVANSLLWAKVDRTLERTGTARNIATMTKLMGLVKGDLH